MEFLRLNQTRFILLDYMRKRVILLLSIVVFAILVITLISKPKKIRDLDAILAEGRLTVLIESGVYGFARDSVLVYGFQYEIIKKFADSLGVELVIINQKNIKDASKMLANGDYDVLVSLKPLVIDSSRATVSLLPMLNSRLVLVQHSQPDDNKLVRKQYELDGDTLFTIKGSAFTQKLTHLFDDLAIDVEVEELVDIHVADLMQMVSAQKIKFTFCPEYLVDRFKADYPDLNFSLPLSFPFDLAWSVHTEAPSLHQKLNDYLDEYIHSQDFILLKEKYLIK